MTPTEINIAIAEYCGWTKRPLAIAGPETWFDPGGIPKGYDESCLTNYHSSLDAMHEAEKMLNEDQLNHMVQILYTMPERFWRASAPQRAEAFLITIGKWKE